MLTYAVFSLNGTQGSGVRCLKPLSQAPGRSGSFNWYGEGNWGNGPYRHIGSGYTELGEFQSGAWAADIYGNGEISKGVARDLQPTITDGEWPNPKELMITGLWGEFWRLVDDVNYNPLPAPKLCGANLTTYRASDLSGTRQGSGLRCVGLVAPGYYIYFGLGNWDTITYTHIGSSNMGPNNGPGTGFGTNICGPAFGNGCTDFINNPVQFARFADGYTVTGPWAEIWRIVLPPPPLTECRRACAADRAECLRTSPNKQGCGIVYNACVGSCALE